MKSTEVLQCHIVVIVGIKAVATCAESTARACQTALEAGEVELIRRATNQVALVRTAGLADVSTTQNVTFGLRVASSATEVPRAEELKALQRTAGPAHVATQAAREAAAL